MTPLQRRLRAAPRHSIVRERDLLYLRTGDDTTLAIACDSNGGIGPKPADVVRCSGYQLGRFATRVPLLELLAAGVTPLALADTLAVEMEPTGRDVLRGVLDEAALAGLVADAVTGSTEDNVPTVATGVGVTVVGTAAIGDLRAGSALPGAAVVLVGRPKAGPEDVFPLDDPEIMHIGALRTLLNLPGVQDVVPVGSHGVRHECDVLAASAGLRFFPADGWPTRPDKSGGPGTTCVAAVTQGKSDAGPDLAALLGGVVGLPAWCLGLLEP